MDTEQTIKDAQRLLEVFHEAYESQKDNDASIKLMVLANYGDLALQKIPELLWIIFDLEDKITGLYEDMAGEDI